MDEPTSVDGQELILLIKRHSEHVKKRTSNCAATVCRHCGLDAANSDTPFIFHGTRARRFLVLAGSYVRKVAAFLARWRCPHCRKTFTDYPPFACRHKAYTLPQIVERAAEYVGHTAITYRKAVWFEGLPIFYADGPAGKSAIHHRDDETPSISIVAHSSLFHWVTTLGKDVVWHLKTLHADFAPASRKYTSERRRSILIACRATCSALFFGQMPTTPTFGRT